MTIFIVFLIIAIALAFEYINGFHDTANAVATSIATKSLTPLQAIVIAAICNIVGALISTNVAITIGKGLINAALVTGIVVLAALLAAIFWNLITWYLGIPSSSSHALIGGLIGSVWFHNGSGAVNFANLINKVIFPMILSPIIAFFLSFLIMAIIGFSFRNNKTPRKTNSFIRELQVVSTAFLSFSHGSNDAQKTMAIITLTLFGYGFIDKVAVPVWVIIACAVCMGLGTLSGGMRIIKTLSSRVAELKPANGFSAELSSATLIFGASLVGLPLSTTQAVSGSIMGAGCAGKSAINWGVVKNMAIAWGLTIPVCIILAAFFLEILMFFR